MEGPNNHLLKGKGISVVEGKQEWSKDNEALLESTLIICERIDESCLVHFEVSDHPQDIRSIELNRMKLRSSSDPWVEFEELDRRKKALHYAGGHLSQEEEVILISFCF